MIPLIMAGMAAAGGIVSIMGQRKADEDRAAAADKEAFLKEIQAAEVQKRTLINIDIQRREGRTLVGQQVSGYASSGVDVGTGSPLLAYQDAVQSTIQNVQRTQEEGDFERYQLKQEAQSSRDFASQIRGAKDLKSLSILFGAASSAASAYGGGGSSGTRDLQGSSQSYSSSNSTAGVSSASRGR